MKILKNGMYLLLVLLLSTTISCNEDEVINNNIGGLDFVIATLNADGNKVGVVATTVPGDNRTLYTVDFGSTADDDTDVFETIVNFLIKLWWLFKSSSLNWSE